MAALDAGDVISRLVLVVGAVVGAIIAVAILFVVLGANPSNSFVSTIHGWGHPLAGPFVGMFTFHSHKATVAVDYGIAIFVYFVLAEVILALIGAVISP